MNIYQNPIPDLDDEPESRYVKIAFHFDNPVTQAEAAENINIWFEQNQITPEMIHLDGRIGTKYVNKQNRLGTEDRDPDGYGPK